MRGTVFHGPYDITLRDDLPEPQVRDRRDAVVRVTASAICGTDLHPYRGELPGFSPGTVLGHEFAGIVVDAGDEVPCRPGQRVVASDLVACGRCRMCRLGRHYQCPEVTLFGYSTVVGRPIDGGQAEYVRIPYADVVLAPCPDGLTDEQALFTGDVLATGYCAAVRAEIPLGGTVAVVGGGAVGMLAGMCALARGAASVVLADPSEARRAAAAAQGFTVAAPAELAEVVAEVSPGRGADSVIEAVGTDAALTLAVETAAAQGTVVAVGAHHSTAAPLDTGRAFARELTLRFVVGDPIACRDEVMALVRTGRVDPTAVVSHRLPLADVVHGYELFHRREATKVVLACGDIC
ncbi:alcohol dehydrogenase catalytic domain-containing protein [Streptomyces sp. BK205]|uniref:alcohol dehydrogenase catalytic domain-containing protein n=1 Tax=Streptomyces sp. BK205 TaxID=2512164 RepID=UPI0010D6FDFF|nr:alcohol dehydrogenase catalytic domain-containing protein [Streptomyces sp. BK205]TCR16057.1 2-desacetyl-2-hydroxyethyl bacteriochlorophyllide A dehydrogenase [Streptomyces sp. BK205]